MNSKFALGAAGAGLAIALGAVAVSGSVSADAPPKSSDVIDLTNVAPAPYTGEGDTVVGIEHVP